MKGFHFFLGLFFLISISASQAIAADGTIPPGLQRAIDSVKEMEQAGASNKDIAAFVKNTVNNRVDFINHKVDLGKRLFVENKELDKKAKRYAIYFDRTGQNSENFNAATWAWENRIGQCNESSAVAFHILAMALESTDQIKTVNIGDHRFVILGDDIQNLPDSFSTDDLRNLDNAYIIDAWDDKSYSTKLLSDANKVDQWYQLGDGQTQSSKDFTLYNKLYDKWLVWCKNHPERYKKWIDNITDPDLNGRKKERVVFGWSPGK